MSWVDSVSAKVPLTEVADEFGTPTYVIDETDLRHRIRRYRAVLPDVRLVYAGKTAPGAGVGPGPAGCAPRFAGERSGSIRHLMSPPYRAWSTRGSPLQGSG